jgi:hypothetical protein
MCGRTLMLTTARSETVGFEQIKELYEQNKEFAEIVKRCKNPVMWDRSMELDYFLQNGYLFKEK